MSGLIGWIIVLPGWIAAVDAIRRPGWQWRAAERERGFWVALLILLSPLFVLPYCFIALPKLAAAAAKGPGASEYQKHDSWQK